MPVPLRIRPALAAAACGAVVLSAGLLAPPAMAADAAAAHAARPSQDDPIRVATFNLSLNRFAEGDLVDDLSTPDNAQAQTVAEIIQRANPDVILLNEFDYVAGGTAVDLFRENYLEVSQQGADPIEFPYSFVAPSNTGIPSGFDLNNNGTDRRRRRRPGLRRSSPVNTGWSCCRSSRSRPMTCAPSRNSCGRTCPAPCCRMTRRRPPPPTGSRQRSSTSSACRASRTGTSPSRSGRRPSTCWHRTRLRPTFDGAEDRNGRRNHDEIRFWADYITPGRAGYIVRRRGAVGRAQRRRSRS